MSHLPWQPHATHLPLKQQNKEKQGEKIMMLK
jgi:hypothetical protein